MTFKNNPRKILFIAASLDILGEIALIFLLAINAQSLNIYPNAGALIIPIEWSIFWYFLSSLSWPFGTYTILLCRINIFVYTALSTTAFFTLLSIALFLAV